MSEENTYPTVPQQISNPINENLKKLGELFPSAVKDGELDIEALREELGDFAEIQPGDEKYELNWAGKQAAKKKAFEPLLGNTLKYVEDESKHPDTTENLYIEGDNLEALKLLRQNYYGAIKMIYIDPPYNTGSDFVYKDNFKISSEESDEAEGARAETGERLFKNERSSSYFHARWLDMLYPRLKYAKELLKQDGAIFISIDENEIHNLRLICDEIFGSSNFISQAGWQKVYSPKNQARYLSNDYEFVLIYAKSIKDFKIGLLPRTAKMNNRYKNPDNDPRGDWKPGDLVAAGERTGGHYIVRNPHNGKEYDVPQGKHWAFSESSMKKMLEDDRIYFGAAQNSFPSFKQFLSEVKQGRVASSFFSYEDYGHTDGAKKEFISLFGQQGKTIFETVKPTKLIQNLARICNVCSGDIILDFFSGSATTSHALFALNAADGLRINSILVQLPETCDEKSEAAKAGYKTIAEIGKERIRRAGDKIKAELIEKAKTATQEEKAANPYLADPESLDIGFKCFRIEDTKINWLKKDLSGGELTDVVISDKDKLDFVPGFTDLDVVYEIMLRQSGIPLTETITTLSDIGSRTYLYGESYLICLEETVSKETVEKLAQLEPTPLKFIFRDSAFGKDIAFKDETFRRLNAEIAKHTDGEETYTVEFI